MGILGDIGVWLWRLLPANPILVRVVTTGGKRNRHLWVRAGYLAALIAVFVLFGGLLLNSTSQSLAELAKQSTRTFMYVSVMQLLLMSFIAPVFCAAAITQEKDSNTFHILLTTPLTNGQIVLGSLFSRLYFVWVLLLSGLPVFCITMLYGGVTVTEVFESFGLAACTGLITGSIAIMISFLKVGTRRTIFSFFVGIAIYLLGGLLIGLSPWGQLATAPLGPEIGLTSQQYRMSWLSAAHPFLALLVVTGQTPAPDPAAVAGHGWPASSLLARPQYGYMWLTTLTSIVMVVISLIFVRRGAREGESTWLNALPGLLRRGDSGERTREPRRVWNNPIAWREANTRGSAGGRSLLRKLYIVGGLCAGFWLLLAHHNQWYGLNSQAPGGYGIETTRSALTAFIWIEFAVILLIITSTAATTLTREKESQTMEILLTTPLTSKYILGGMLQGLVRLVLPLIAVPVGTLLMFAIVDLFSRGAAVTTLEAVALVGVMITGYAALSAVIGLQYSLNSKKTVQAVMSATATVLFITGLLSLCGFSLNNSTSGVRSVVVPLTAFPALQLLVDPWIATIDANAPNQRISDPAFVNLRIVRSVFALIASGALFGITAMLYNGLVRGFDMTVRRQSA